MKQTLAKYKEIGFLFIFLLFSSMPLSASFFPNVLDGEWPVVGQDYGNLANAPSTIDSSNAANLFSNQKFFFPTSGLVVAQPAVSNGVAYFGDTSGTVYAIDISTGQQIWATSIGNEVITTPSVSENLIYVTGGQLAGTFSGDPVKIFAINRSDGSIAWSNKVDPLSGTLPFIDDYTGDTTIVGNLVIFGVASTENTSMPAADSKARGSVVAFNRFTGEERWRFYTTSDQSDPNPRFGGGSGAWSSPAIDLDRKLLFIGTGQNFETPCSPFSDSLLALDFRNGRLRWFSQKTINDVWDVGQNSYGADWDVNTHPNLFSAEVEGEGEVDFVGVGDKGGRYFIMQRDQRHSFIGKPKIDVTLFLDEGSKPGAIQATPTIDNVNKILYVVSDALVGPFGTRTSMNAVQLDYFVLDVPNYQGEVIPKYAAYDLTQLVNGASPSAALLWEYDSTTDPNNRGQTFGPLTLSNDVIFTTNGTGNVRIFKASDGTLIDEIKPLGVPAPIFGGVTVVDKQIFIPTTGGIASYEIP